MGIVTDGAEIYNGPPDQGQNNQQPTKASILAAAEDASVGHAISPSWGGGGGNGGGSQPPGGSGGGDYPGDRYLGWNAARETSRASDGKALTTVTLGHQGYTQVVNHPVDGWGKTTGHIDGTIHRHGYMSDASPKGDFVKSNEPYRGIIGNVIGSRKPSP